jgi:GNAT superfamily N-acetyltransferase
MSESTTPARLVLPHGYTARPPRREEAQALADILAACELANTGKSEITLNDFLGDWEGTDLERNALVIADGGDRPVAYADIDVRGDVIFSVYGYVHPSQRGHGFGSYLIAWGEWRANDVSAGAPSELRVAARHYVNEQDEAARALLTKRGYEAVRITYTMAIELLEEPPAPQWPEGLTPRTFQPGVDDEATYEAYEEAFSDLWQRPRGTLEQSLSKLRRPYFNPELWLLAMDGDEIAGVVLADDIDGNGWIEIVGVRRPWRNRGLALAMLHHTFGEFYRRGVTHVGLSVDAMSPTGAPRLYDRAGMKLDQTYFLFERELRPGVPPGA